LKSLEGALPFVVEFFLPVGEHFPHTLGSLPSLVEFFPPVGEHFPHTLGSLPSLVEFFMATTPATGILEFSYLPLSREFIKVFSQVF
jgi:hypothetical protein